MLKDNPTESELLDQAERLTALHQRKDLIREALTALIERERARQLARLGGSDPDLQDIPRRRWESA